MRKILIPITLIFTILLSSCSVMNGRGIGTGETSDTSESPITSETESLSEDITTTVSPETLTTTASSDTTESPKTESGTDKVTTAMPENFVFTQMDVYAPSTYGGPISSSIQESKLHESRKKTYSVPVESTVKIGRVELSADLIEDWDYEWQFDRSVYLSKDGKVKYTLYISDATDLHKYKSHCFTIAIPNPTARGTYISEYPYDEITEENVIRYIKDYMSEYVDVSILDELVFSAETRGTLTTKEGESSSHTESGIVASGDYGTDAYFKSRGYTVEYSKFIEGIRTDNSVRFILDEFGNITSFTYFITSLETTIKNNPEWKNGAFEDLNIQFSIAETLRWGVMKGFNISDWYIADKELSIINNKLTMAVTINAKVTFTDSSHVVRQNITLYFTPFR